MLGSVIFLVLAAIFMGVIHLIADHLENKKADREIEQALRDWREAHPDTPQSRQDAPGAKK